DAAAVPALNPPPGSTGVGDRHYWDPALRQRLAAAGGALKAPDYHKSQDKDPAGSAELAAGRDPIGAGRGQLTERVGSQRGGARALGHLCQRLPGKTLSHAVLRRRTARAKLPPLSFDRLWAA